MQNKKMLLFVVLFLVVFFSTAAYAEWKCRYCGLVVDKADDASNYVCLDGRTYHVMEEQSSSSGCNVGISFVSFGALGSIASGLFVLKRHNGRNV